MSFNQVSLVFAFALVGAVALGQTAKPKAAAKLTGTQAGPMAGGSGKIGTPYKLGKKGDELHFTLEKAEFAMRAVTADGTILAPPDKRLIIVHFAVQNPHKTEKFFFNQSFKFTVVSPDDENFEGLGDTGGNVYHPDRRDKFSLQLKPVQKVRAFAAFAIHPNGPVNKLIVQRGDETAVLRYDLKELVKPLAGAFSATEGLGSISVGAAIVKAPFELGTYDVTVESFDEATVPGYEPNNGEKIVAAVLSVKNGGMVPSWMSSSIITAKLFDEDGSESPGVAMIKNSSADSLNMNMEKGAQVRCRLVFRMPAAARANRLVLRDQFSERSVVVALAVP